MYSTEVFARIILDTIKIYDVNFDDDVLERKKYLHLKQREWTGFSLKGNSKWSCVYFSFFFFYEIEFK